MRDPSAGRAEFGALVRMTIQCELSQGFEGRMNSPLNVAPAASLIVSPHDALFRAVCKLPPAATRIVPPGAGVFAMAVLKKTEGSCAGPSEPPLVVVEAAETDKTSVCEELTLVASVTLAVIEKVPAW